MTNSKNSGKDNKMGIQKGLVSITITNWNSENYIIQCLDSIKGQTYPNIEIIIVDNNSADRSLEYIEKHPLDITVVKNDKNMGFSKAHNRGIRLSRGEYVLPLNFDIVLEPNFVSEMVKSLRANPAAGTVSGKLYKMINGTKSKIIDSTGIMMEQCFMRPRGETEEDVGQYDRPEHVEAFGACGAAPLYRREMLEDIECLDEFFDEDFVNYVEDVDLSWRAVLRNWKCIYNPKAVAYHERGATRKRSSKMLVDYLVFGFRNRYCAMFKNITPGYWRKNRFKILGSELLFLLASLRGTGTPRIVRLKAFCLFLGMSGRMLTKRRIIQKRVLVSDDYLETLFCFNGLDLRQKVSKALTIEKEAIRQKLATLKTKTVNN